MAAAHHPLPDLDALNPNELKALIVAQHQEIFLQHEQLLHKDEQLLSRDNEIEHLKLLLAKLRRQQFGQKSEKLDRQIEQLELRLDELETARAEKVFASQTPAVSASAVNAAAKPARRPLPEHLPRETRKYPPKQTACPDCGAELKHLGEDVSEMLEYVPARFKVIRQVRPKLACACCERIVQAEAPSRPIERGVAGPGRGVGTLDAGGLGGRNERVTCVAGGSVAASRDERDEVARRRHAGSGAGARQRQNKNRAAVDLCSR